MTSKRTYDRRNFKKRMDEAGLVKCEVYVPPKKKLSLKRSIRRIGGHYEPRL